MITAVPLLPPDEGPCEAEGIDSGRASMLELVVRATAVVVAPFLAFWWRVGLWTLNPLAAPRMIVYDYSTYISGPNFLRTAPLFSIPIGSTPDHIAPVGASLGLTDSTPLLTPLYRVLNAISPNRPTQLVGPILLLAYIGTFICCYKLVRLVAAHWQMTGRDAFIAGLLGASALILNPMYLYRFVHPTLMNHWVVLWPLYTLVRSRLRRDPISRRRLLVALVQLAAASAIQPYFLPMVIVLHAPLFIAVARQRVRYLLAFSAAYVAVTGSISYLLGYVSSGVSRQNEGYGNFAANLTFLIDPSWQSRLLHDIPSLPDSWEGRGYLGAGVLLIGSAAIVALLASAPQRARSTLGWFWPALAGGVLLAVLAVLPVVYLGTWRMVDLRTVLRPIDGVLETFRTNGRLVWVLSWTVGATLVAAIVALRSRVLVFVLLGLCVLVQAHDLTPTPLGQRSAADYGRARDVLLQAKRNGATSVVVMPPSIMTACTSDQIPIDQIDPVILAAAVLRLSVNSGYPGRPVPDYVSQICEAEVSAFDAGERDGDDVYVLNSSRPETATMKCQPISPALVACTT
jgi:hypothetical protein